MRRQVEAIKVKNNNFEENTVYFLSSFRSTCFEHYNDFQFRKVIGPSLINYRLSTVVNVSPGLNSINNYLRNLIVHSYGNRFINPDGSWTQLSVLLCSFSLSFV